MQVPGAGGTRTESCLVHRLAPPLKLPLQEPLSLHIGLGVLADHEVHIREDTKLGHWWSLGGHWISAARRLGRRAEERMGSVLTLSPGLG